MKICLINNLYEPYQRGGAEQVVKNIVQELKKEHDVFLISTKPFWGKKISTDKIYYINSFYYSLRRIPLPFRLFWHVYNIFDIYVAIKIYFILRREKPDIVFTHNLLGLSFLLPLIIRMLKIKHIHTLHDIQLLHPSGLMYYGNENIINSFIAKIYQFFTKFLFSFVNVIISPSKWLLGYHLNKNFFKNGKKIIMLNPYFSYDIDKRKISDGIFRFIFIGQIEKHKGIFLLIDAFKKLDQQGKELIIIGSGSYLEKIKNDVIDYTNIKILGKKNNQEVFSFLAMADCLIMPSLCYENSPTVIYEAFMSGLPVIASNIGGNLELINHYGGLLFQTGDENDLVDKMKLIIKNPQIGDRVNFINDIRLDNYIKKLIYL